MSGSLIVVASMGSTEMGGSLIVGASMGSTTMGGSLIVGTSLCYSERFIKILCLNQLGYNRLKEWFTNLVGN